ncbi:MAG TPA: hypothetical protein VD905_17425 [Flavobacteriales bacterium]|nr:hypothetical protein [Flavobacteriales bacterium]
MSFFSSAFCNKTKNHVKYSGISGYFLFILSGCSQREAGTGIRGQEFAARLAADSIEIVYRNAEELLSLIHREKALETFKTLVHLPGNRSRAYTGLATAYFLHYYTDTVYADSAIQAFEKALALDKTNCDALIGISGAIISKTNCSPSLVYLRRAEKCDGKSQQLTWLRAMAYDRAGKPDSAVLYARMYLEYDSSSNRDSDEMKLILLRNPVKK